MLYLQTFFYKSNFSKDLQNVLLSPKNERTLFLCNFYKSSTRMGVPRVPPRDAIGETAIRVSKLTCYIYKYLFIKVVFFKDLQNVFLTPKNEKTSLDL